MSATEMESWEQLSSLLAPEVGGEELQAYIGGLPPGDLVRAIFRLSRDEQVKLLATLSPESAAEVIEEIPEAHAVELIDELPVEAAASIMGEMPSDEQADLLSELDEDEAEAILEHMDADDAAEARQLIAYAADVAGGLMMTEVISYPRNATVGEVIDDLSRREADYALYNVQYVYIVSPKGRLHGVLRLRDMVVGDPRARLGRIVTPALSVPPEATLDELEEFFDHHELAAVPVTNRHQRLLGVVRRRSVYEALAARAEAESLKLQGIVGGEELRSLPALTRSRRRLSWLSVNILLNIVAASIIALYQDTLSAAIALAVFLPIVSDMSGCSGNQAVAVSLRELTLGIILPRDAVRVWLKEVAVGVVNGLVLGLLLASAAWLWQGNVVLGLVVGGALALNTVVAVSIGGTVPLVLRGLKIDPALASGPVLTTVTDMCGFFFVLSFATLTLPALSQ